MYHIQPYALSCINYKITKMSRAHISLTERINNENYALMSCVHVQDPPMLWNIVATPTHMRFLTFARTPGGRIEQVVRIQIRPSTEMNPFQVRYSQPELS